MTYFEEQCPFVCDYSTPQLPRTPGIRCCGWIPAAVDQKIIIILQAMIARGKQSGAWLLLPSLPRRAALPAEAEDHAAPVSPAILIRWRYSNYPIIMLGSCNAIISDGSLRQLGEFGAVQLKWYLREVTQYVAEWKHILAGPHARTHTLEQARTPTSYVKASEYLVCVDSEWHFINRPGIADENWEFMRRGSAQIRYPSSPDFHVYLLEEQNILREEFKCMLIWYQTDVPRFS